jgi:hypothetical protein
MDERFLDEFVAWHLRVGDTLRSGGVEVTLKGPTVDFGKNSVVLELMSPSRAMSVVVWESGEFEVITALEDHRWEPEVEVGDLPDPESVAGLLDRATAEFPGRT